MKPSGDVGTGVVRDWRLTRLHDAFLAKQGQHPIQCFRVAPTKVLLPTPKAQESVHDLLVHRLYLDVFVLQPPAEIGDGDDLPSDRVVSIALFGDGGRVGVAVFAQRTLAQSFNSA
jgi:hypothetical protein